MMNTLNITWNFGKGRMQILLDKFFPSTKKDLKQLLKIISLDWEHETELKESLKVYFQEQKTVHEAAKKRERKETFRVPAEGSRHKRNGHNKEASKRCPSFRG